MPKYTYLLTEKTTLWHEVEAQSLDEANEMVQDFLDSGLVDWGIGDMECRFDYSHKGDLYDN